MTNEIFKKYFINVISLGDILKKSDWSKLVVLCSSIELLKDIL